MVSSYSFCPWKDDFTTQILSLVYSFKLTEKMIYFPIRNYVTLHGIGGILKNESEENSFFI